jgi:hypothetical protein
LLRTKVRPISELFMNDLDDLPVVLDDDVHVGIEFDNQGMATLKPLGVTLPESSPLQLRLNSLHVPLIDPDLCVARRCTSMVSPSVAQRMVCLSCGSDTM